MKLIKSKWLLFVATCWAFTPLVFYAAYLERGYWTTGGEILFPLVPVLIWLFAKTIADVIKALRDGVTT